MEIERKWMVEGWPEGLPVVREHQMRQGYLAVSPVVRIREEAEAGGCTEWILCMKKGDGIVRDELEIRISREEFLHIEEMIGKPLIRKERRTYALADDLFLEVSLVDEGEETEFFYAEIEYPTLKAALSWTAERDGLTEYLREDVSDLPGQTMAEYWADTRGI